MQQKNIKINSNRSFGIVFFIVFLIVSFFPLLNEGDIRIWFRFGILLGSLVSPIVMSVVFFIVVTPISLMMKLSNKNLLGLKKINKSSYWINSSKIKSKMKNQF